MSTLVLFNPRVVINSVDLSGHIDMVTIDETLVDLDVTTFGNTAKRHAAGLSDNKFTLEFLQDFAASSVYATIQPLVGTSTNIIVQPVKDTTTMTNPAFTFTAWVLQWKLLDGKAGDVSKASVSWPIDGVVTVLTS